MSAPAQPTFAQVWRSLLRFESLAQFWDAKVAEREEAKRRASLRDGNPDNYTWREQQIAHRARMDTILDYEAGRRRAPGCTCRTRGEK